VSFSGEDHAFMARALRLTRHGRETATPNPNVGCVIVKRGRVIGEGWHEKAGTAHAEAHALGKCTESPEGATVYVTLEPCAHHGRTPPCADALVNARVARAVVALEDPNPQVAGKGFARLREAGVAVDVGLMAEQARAVHRGFLSRMQRGRPWVTVKLGASLDARTALPNGASRWITSAEARRDVHALGARSCAVLTGIGTVKLDDPALTVRDVPCHRQPLRVVLDHRLEVADDAAILQGGSTLLLCTEGNAARVTSLTARGVEVASVPVDAANGKADLPALMHFLGERGINELLVETGAKLNGSLLRAGVVDEIVLYVAPSILGDSAAGLFAIGELADLRDKIELKFVDVRSVGPDLRITANVVEK
jgi:diaminohydroxyphosphoribosylaminopyrimidine deaminase/5-amino-6-(5-phosphoribosylamino)uracil reductase